MHDVKEIDDRRPIVGDRDPELLMDQFVHPTRTQGCRDDPCDRFTGIDVTDQLRFTLAGVRAFLQDQDSVFRPQTPSPSPSE